MKTIKNQFGQGLVEYLIIVAIMAVAAIAVLRVVSQNTRAQFANIANALQGQSRKVQLQQADVNSYNNKDMSNFMNGSAQGN